MPLRIAFDLDGVLADMESELLRQARALFGESITRGPREPIADSDHTSAAAAAVVSDQTTGDVTNEPSGREPLESTPPLSTLKMSARRERKLWRHVETIENFWETLEETEPGLINRLSAVATERRWEIMFLTKRPQTSGSTAQLQTQRWLRSKGFALPSVFVVQGSRGRIAAALNLHIVVDDRPENCLDVVVDSNAKAILVWREDEKHLPEVTRRLGIGVVKTTAECLDILTEADATTTTADGGGVMQHVRRLFGMKASTSVRQPT